jgi:hypothetical protein
VGLYSGFLSTFTPTAGVANAVLETASGGECFAKEVVFGGQVTTSTAMQTRLTRDSAIGTGSRTAGNSQKMDNHSQAQLVYFSTTYGTLQPTVVAGCLFGTSLGCDFWLAA